jgi:hypothetical protein
MIVRLSRNHTGILKVRTPKQALGSIVSVSGITQDSAVLTWTDDDNGDATVQKYIIYANDVEKGQVSAGEELTFTVDGLDPDTDYTFKVRKVTDLGNVDSSGMYSIQRKVFTGGQGFTTNILSFNPRKARLGREPTEDYEDYAEGPGYGNDVDDIFYSSNEGNYDRAIIKSTSGLYYSIGRQTGGNFLGRLDANGSSFVGSDFAFQREPNGVLNSFIENNPGKKIKKLALTKDYIVALMEDGTLYNYGSFAYPNAYGVLKEVTMYNDIIADGWVGHDVQPLRAGVCVHMKKDGFKDKIYFHGKEEFNNFGMMVGGGYTTTIHTSPVENPVIKHMIEDLNKNVEDIRGDDLRLYIKMDGEWIGMGDAEATHSAKQTLATSWSESSRAYEAITIDGVSYSPDPQTPNTPQAVTGPIKMDGLNAFLTTNPGSDVYETGYLCMYTPEGKFYYFYNKPSEARHITPELSSQNSTDETAIPSEYMNLEYIGKASGYNDDDYLSNVQGTLIKFYNLRHNGAFLMSIKTEIVGPVRTGS